MQKWNISYRPRSSVEMCTKDLLNGKPRLIAHIQLSTILNTGTFLMLTSK